MSGDSLRLADGQIDVWADHWSIDLVHQRPTIGELQIDDVGRWLPDVREIVREAAADRTLAEPKAGGHRRIHDLEEWDSPALELLMLRASKLCKAMMNTDQVALQDASALLVERAQSVPGAWEQASVATVTALLAGPPRLSFEHAMHRAVRLQPSETCPPGTLWAHPAQMPVRVPAWTSDAPLMLAVFQYRRLV